MKSTYSAIVHVPAQLTALMSAVPDQSFAGSNKTPGKKTFKFNQVLLTDSCLAMLSALPAPSVRSPSIILLLQRKALPLAITCPCA